jgi:hypothetical protein
MLRYFCHSELGSTGTRGKEPVKHFEPVHAERIPKDLDPARAFHREDEALAKVPDPEH